MSASVKGRPAGTPSMTAVNASPWDSPAVRKRKISAIDEAPVARRSEYHAARGDRRPRIRDRQQLTEAQDRAREAPPPTSPPWGATSGRTASGRRPAPDPAGISPSA